LIFQGGTIAQLARSIQRTSNGGILGFEIARQLRELKHEVSFCGIIDTGIDPAVTIRDPIPFGQHLVRAAANLPRWTLFNCGPENRKKPCANSTSKRTIISIGLLRWEKPNSVLKMNSLPIQGMMDVERFFGNCFVD
jgi:hypothetical protein